MNVTLLFPGGPTKTFSAHIGYITMFSCVTKDNMNCLEKYLTFAHLFYAIRKGAMIASYIYERNRSLPLHMTKVGHVG